MIQTSITLLSKSMWHGAFYGIRSSDASIQWLWSILRKKIQIFSPTSINLCKSIMLIFQDPLSLHQVLMLNRLIAINYQLPRVDLKSCLNTPWAWQKPYISLVIKRQIKTSHVCSMLHELWFLLSWGA